MTRSAGVDLFDPTATDEFLDQMLSSVPSTPWSDLPSLPNNDSLTFYHHHHPSPPNPHHHPLLLPHSPFPYSSSLPPLNSLGGDVGGVENGMYKGGCTQREMGQITTTTTPQLIQVGGGGKAKQRVRARRGQATDPHSIAERLRRERIAERMKALQELVPNANKSDKASMLDEIIDYVKFLQLQVKVLSMSRLGGAAASVSPHPTTTISKVEGGNGGEMGVEVEAAEKHVAKLLEEDMGTAMQYLQGKGLCLMPISLATAISSTARNNPLFDPSPAVSGSTDPAVIVTTTAAATID